MSEIRLNRAAYEHNLRVLATKAGGTDRVMLVLKDNAYGHGARMLAGVASELGFTRAVVKNEREAGEIDEFFDEILILSHIPHANESEKFTYAINNIDAINALKQGARVHLAIDTMMHRNGVCIHEIDRALELIKTRELRLEGAFTHFRSSDELNADYFVQRAKFNDVKAQILSFCLKNALPMPIFHSHNSASFERVREFNGRKFSCDNTQKSEISVSADHDSQSSQEVKNLSDIEILKRPVSTPALSTKSYQNALEQTEFASMPADELARVGIAQLGYSQFDGSLGLRPVLSLWARRVSSRVLRAGQGVGYGAKFIATSDMQIATYDLGYGDGLLRYNGCGELKTACKARILGCMSMDSFSCEDVGEWICLFDDVREWARFFGTIEYEILVKLSPFLDRKWI